jgi:hypothetical protein
MTHIYAHTRTHNTRQCVRSDVELMFKFDFPVDFSVENAPADPPSPFSRSSPSKKPRIAYIPGNDAVQATTEAYFATITSDNDDHDDVNNNDHFDCATMATLSTDTDCLLLRKLHGNGPLRHFCAGSSNRSACHQTTSGQQTLCTRGQRPGG